MSDFFIPLVPVYPVGLIILRGLSGLGEVRLCTSPELVIKGAAAPDPRLAANHIQGRKR